MATEIKVPALGESVTEATVSKWFKQPGDAVAVDESLCELETDKVTVEVPSPVSGALQSIAVLLPPRLLQGGTQRRRLPLQHPHLKKRHPPRPRSKSPPFRPPCKS